MTNKTKPSTTDSPTAVTAIMIMIVSEVDRCFLELSGIGVGVGSKTLIIRYVLDGFVASNRNEGKKEWWAYDLRIGASL